MKESKQTVRETVQKDVKTVHCELLKESRKYIKHRFQIKNDRYHWKIILHRNQGTIFHMDFSKMSLDHLNTSFKMQILVNNDFHSTTL